MIHIDIRSNFSILCPNFSRQCYNHSRWLSNFSRFSFQFFKCANTFLVLGPLRGPLEVVAEALELSESRASASLNNQGPFSVRIPNNQTVSKKSNKKTFCSQHICGFFCRGGAEGMALAARMISRSNLKKWLFMQLLSSFRSEPLEPEGWWRSKHYNFLTNSK